MAHNEITDGAANGLAGDIVETIQVTGQDIITLPDAGFIKQSNILRDGQDLVLEGPDGGVVILEGYYNASPAPMIQSSSGETLTPDLVQSFVQTAGPIHIADLGSMTDESPVGAVQEVSGTATVTHVNGTTEELTIGTPVYQGDIIETNGNGAVSIEFVDETTFSVSQNAKLAIDEYVFDPATESGTSDFSILRGLFVFTSGLIGRDDPDDVEIDTPMGSIGIRGTTIAGNIDTGEITVLEGAIVIRSLDGAEVTLASQFETARFEPASGGVSYVGIVDSQSFAEGFEVLKSVSPAFFSSLTVPQAGNETGAETAPEQNTAPADTSGADSNEPQEQGAAEQPAPQSATYADTSSNFDGTTDTTFEDTAAADNTANTVTGTGNTADAATTTASGNTATGGTSANTVPADTTQQQPPPSTVTGNNGGTGGSAAGGGPVLLNNLGGADGFMINGAAGSGFGYSIAYAGDTNNDGLANFLVTQNVSAAGSVHNYNANNATPIQMAAISIDNTNTPSVDGVGDFNGDGMLDFVTGGPFADISNADTGSVVIHVAGSSIITGLDAGDMAGYSVSGLGDINGDGYSDVIAGAPGTDNGGINYGSAYILFGNASPGGLDASALSGTQGIKMDGSLAMNNALFGEAVSGAGDFDGDGYADFMITEYTGPSTAEVMMFMGDSTSAMFDNVADAVHTFTGIGTNGNDIPIMKMGDVDGDGVSDIAIADTLNNQIHMIYGGATTDTDLSDGVGSGYGYTIMNSGSGIIDGGGFAGDFNGDGLSDGAFVVRDGNIADIFVVYGSALRTGPLDIQSLYNNDTEAYHIAYDVGHTGAFDFSFSTAGDTNGDGFDDLLVGMSQANGGDGAVAVIYGHNNTALTSDGQLTHIAGQTTAMNDVVANANNQALVGNNVNNILDDNSQAYTSMSGGAGNDTFNISNVMLGNLDGGSGDDKIEFFGDSLTLDFANMGSERIDGIEKIIMNNNNQMVRLGLDDIFRLMQSSDDIEGGRQVLKIADLGGGATTLDIVQNAAGSSSPFTGSVFGLSADVGDVNDGGIVFDQYNFGTGYALLIDQNIDTVNLVA